MSESITAKNYQKLSIQVSVNELSFCCFDTLNDTILDYKKITFSKNQPIEEQLEKTFVDNSILSKPYDQIMVLHDNSFNTFVPDVLFNEEFIGSYLQYNTKVFKTDFFTFDKIISYEINNVYVPFMHINNFLIDKYGIFEYKNTNSILVKKLLDNSKNRDEKQIFIHIQNNHFEIVVLNKQKLLLFNSFEYKTPEDFIYYVLFTIEQLQLNPETIPLFLLGDVTESTPCYTIVYKYIRNISLLETNTLQAKWNKSEAEILQHYILFNS